MPIVLPALPYGKDSLEPFISARTLEFHHDKHHNAYVSNVNKLIAGSKFEKMDLVAMVKNTYNDFSNIGIFNNAAQVWNHSFYWSCMKPSGGGHPTGKVSEMIIRDFENHENFIEQFKNAGMGQFGSGWAWLVLEKEMLKITKTLNADTPIAHGQKPLLTVDVWEHAYYLDYQNRRPDYLNDFIEKLINWDFVNSQLNQ